MSTPYRPSQSQPRVINSSDLFFEEVDLSGSLERYREAAKRHKGDRHQYLCRVAEEMRLLAGELIGVLDLERLPLITQFAQLGPVADSSRKPASLQFLVLPPKTNSGMVTVKGLRFDYVLLGDVDMHFHDEEGAPLRRATVQQLSHPSSWISTSKHFRGPHASFSNTSQSSAVTVHFSLQG